MYTSVYVYKNIKIQTPGPNLDISSCDHTTSSPRSLPEGGGDRELHVSPGPWESCFISGKSSPLPYYSGWCNIFEFAQMCDIYGMYCYALDLDKSSAFGILY